MQAGGGGFLTKGLPMQNGDKLRPVVDDLAEMIRTIRDMRTDDDDAEDIELFNTASDVVFDCYHAVLRGYQKTQRGREIKQTIAKHFGA